ARWGSFLLDKIATVRGNRERLRRQGLIISSALSTYLQQVQNGELSAERARSLALEWMSTLSLGDAGNVWVFDADYNVLTSALDIERFLNIDDLVDYKGRPLAESVYQEVRVVGQSFAIYRVPDGTSAQGAL